MGGREKSMVENMKSQGSRQDESLKREGKERRKSVRVCQDSALLPCLQEVSHDGGHVTPRRLYSVRTGKITDHTEDMTPT